MYIHVYCTYIKWQAADGPYYWLLHKLGIYKPVTWEYGRCNITYNVLSKRRLNALVTHKFVNVFSHCRMCSLTVECVLLLGNAQVRECVLSL